MKYYPLLKRGTAHADFCEDFMYTKAVSENLFIGAVFDGCSGGDNSHFASSLAGKLMRNVCENIDNAVFDKDLDFISDTILTKFFTEYRKAQTVLNLTNNDLLSTVILLIYDETKKNALVRTFGDGFVAGKGEQHIIDQDNMPEYPVYFFDEAFAEENSLSLSKIKSQRFFFENASDITISTDGIFSFKLEGISDIHDLPDPIDFLSRNTDMDNLFVMLQRKYNLLNNKYKLKNYDDIAAIRVRCENI